MDRFLARLGLVIAMLLPMAVQANHDRLPDPPPRSTSQKLPAIPTLDRSAITVSGLSSGGFFAHQFHVAFSRLVKGAGIIAGGPFGCVESISQSVVALLASIPGSGVSSSGGLYPLLW